MGSTIGAPGNRSVAVQQHASGHAHAWDHCTSCGAVRGAQCYALGVRREAEGPPKRKRRPCAGRVWQPRRSDHPSLTEGDQP